MSQAANYQIGHVFLKHNAIEAEMHLIFAKKKKKKKKNRKCSLMRARTHANKIKL